MFSSDFIKAILLKLNQPSSLAVAISLGIHVLLGASVQSSSLFSSSQNSRNLNTVGLIELNELETQNLPPLSAPPAPNTPLPNIDDLFPTTTSRTDINTPIPNLGTSQNPSPLTYPIKPRSSLPRVRTRVRRSSRNLSVEEQLARLRQRRELERRQRLEELKRRQQQRPNQPSPLENPVDLLPGREDRKTPPPPASPPQETLTGDQNRQIIARKPTKKPIESPAPETEPDPPQPSPEEIALEKEKKITALAENLREQRDKLRPDGTNPDEDPGDAYREDLVALLRTVPGFEQNPNIAQQTNYLSLPGNYPQEACPKQLSGTAIYIGLLSPEGEIFVSPEVSKSSGYPIFNEQAIADINAHEQFSPPNDGKFHPYQIAVEYKYDPEACPSIFREPLNSPETTTPVEALSTPDTPDSESEPLEESESESFEGEEPQSSEESESESFEGEEQSTINNEQ